MNKISDFIDFFLHISNPSTWNEDTVEQLSNLAVYFKSNLCVKIPIVCESVLF